MQIEDLYVEFDNSGRVKYHPLIHDKQDTIWSEEDKEYLCKYYEVDVMETIAFALGRTKATVVEKLRTLRESGDYEYYKNLNKHW